MRRMDCDGPGWFLYILKLFVYKGIKSHNEAWFYLVFHTVKSAQTHNDEDEDNDESSSEQWGVSLYSSVALVIKPTTYIIVTSMNLITMKNLTQNKSTTNNTQSIGQSLWKSKLYCAKTLMNLILTACMQKIHMRNCHIKFYK